jgi:hypothetical protein
MVSELEWNVTLLDSGGRYASQTNAKCLIYSVMLAVPHGGSKFSTLTLLIFVSPLCGRIDTYWV